MGRVESFLVLGDELRQSLLVSSLHDVMGWWDIIIQTHGRQKAYAWLGRNDRFFLATVLLKRVDLIHPWLYERCREVQKEPDGYLDLWARESGKSSLITLAGTVQEVLCNPEITVGIFSHTKPSARKFLRQIKQEFEANELLKSTYPDVLYAKPAKEAPRWSEDGGLVVRRQSNPKESTIEAHGLVDGQPTGAHFQLLVYDDVVTLESVSTPEQVRKATEAWSLSDNLGARGANGKIRKWHIGTRYSYADSYHDMLEMGAIKPRVYAATDDGTVDGNPVFLSPEAWAEKKRNLIPTVLASQMLQNPAAGNEALFRQEWLSFQEVRPATLNVYILVDPASSRKKGSDFTAVAVIGVDAGWNLWLLDGLYDRLRLNERWQAVKDFRRTWMRAPGVQQVKVGYERYGMQADLEYFDLEMRRDRDVFDIAELAWPREGGGSKLDRIQRLVPFFKNARFHMPAVVEGETTAQRRVKSEGQEWRIYKPVRRKDYLGTPYALNKVLITEFLSYPYSVHDDFLDACSRIFDIEALAPIQIDERHLEPEVFEDGI